MAKCDLAIELDDPKAIYGGGSKITGLVRVSVDKDVKCKGLEISSLWKTHGRGNIATGTTHTITVFEGHWAAGDKIEYRFELPVGEWPPSYHGNYLNVDHYIDARAKIPWGFDPKASQAFLMQPTCGPEGAEIKQPATVGGVWGCVVGSIFLSIFVGIFAAIIVNGGGIFLLLFASIIPIFGGGAYFFRVFLPKYLLGNVQYELTPKQVSPGYQVQGELIIRPRKNVPINAINMTFKASEVVVSGSGSNRTTHRNVFFEKDTTLQGESVLQAGQEHRFPVSVQLPEDAPYTLELDDNKLIWSTFLRVDIPRWPDWTQEVAIAVVPSGDQQVQQAPSPSADDQSMTASPHVEPSGITFTETATHLWELREDDETVTELTDAVTGLTFNIDAVVERRLLYSGEEDPHVFKDGYAIWAHFTDPPLPMVLYAPHDMADEFEQIGRDIWRGRGTIVGWDHQHRRLQIKLESRGSL